MGKSSSVICQAPKLSVTGGYGVDSVVVVVVVVLVVVVVVVFRNGSLFSEVIKYDVAVDPSVDEVGSNFVVKNGVVDAVVVLDDDKCFVAETVSVVEGVVVVDVDFVVMNPCLILS